MNTNETFADENLNTPEYNEYLDQLEAEHIYYDQFEE